MMRLDRLIRVIGGRPDGTPGTREAGGVSVDTRTLRPGDVFFALRGSRFDAHDFVPEAFERGACAAVVERPVGAAGGLQVIVEDAGAALGELAAAWRMALGARVVGITGSNGKTTTKEMIGSLLGADRRGVRARGSFNNFVGLPLTILEARPGDAFLVLEIGTNHPGEIARLGRIARPDVAVITNVGASHLEGLGTIEGVAEEKASLLGCLRAGGVGIVHEDPRLLRRIPLPRNRVRTFGASAGADFFPERVEARPGAGTRFSVRGVEFHLGLLGEWNVLNALAACAVADAFGIPLAECARRLEGFRGPRMRMERLEVGGLTVINDAYNSNPESASRAILEFSRLPARGRKVAVIGDMLELGASTEAFHRLLGRQLAAGGVDVVAAVGPACRALLEELPPGRPERYGFDSVEGLRPRIGELFRPGDLVLLKGSRGMGLERLIPWISGRVA